MAPFDRSHTSSQWRSLVTMALSRIVSERKRDIVRKNHNFYTLRAFDAPAMGNSVGISPEYFVLKKLELLRQ